MENTHNISMDEDTVHLESLFYFPLEDVMSLDELYEMTIFKAPTTSEISIDMDTTTETQMLQQLFPEGASLHDLIPDFDLDLGPYEEEWLWSDGSIRPTKEPMAADYRKTVEQMEFDWGDLPSPLPMEPSNFEIDDWAVWIASTDDWNIAQQEVGEDEKEEQEF